MGAYMAESFKDLHVGSDIEQLFQYIEDYKPVHLDLEDSGTNLFATPASQQYHDDSRGNSLCGRWNLIDFHIPMNNLKEFFDILQDNLVKVFRSRKL